MDKIERLSKPNLPTSLHDLNHHTNRKLWEGEQPLVTSSIRSAAKEVFDRSFAGDGKIQQSIRDRANSPREATEMWWRGLMTDIRMPQDPGEVQRAILEKFGIRFDLGSSPHHQNYRQFVEELGRQILSRETPSSKNSTR